MTKRPKLGAVFSGDAVSRPAATTAGHAPTVTEAPATERIVQLNVAVPESLRRRIKIKALQSGKDMNTVVQELLTAWLAE